MKRVIDTNVPVVANGRNTNASLDCRLAAIEFLKLIVINGQTILDVGGEIQSEYHRYLRPSGQPGVGDRFYQMILNSTPERVQRITLAKDAKSGEYVDFPNDPALAAFDKSDKKFAAAARACDVPVANATDSGWLHYEATLAANGVVVEFVCGCNPETWFS